MNSCNATETTIAQGRALVRASDGLQSIHGCSNQSLCQLESTLEEEQKEFRDEREPL